VTEPTELIPTYSELELPDSFAKKVARYRVITTEQGELKREKAQIHDEIVGLLAYTGQERCRTGECRVTMTPSERRKLVKEKLIAAGVTPEQIHAATKVTPCLTLTVRYLNEDDTSEDAE
jgi:hypothetical protein